MKKLLPGCGYPNHIAGQRKFAYQPSVRGNVNCRIWSHLEPQEKFKDLLVELDVIVRAYLLVYPPRQGWGFVVDEDASVLDARRTVFG
jgi:hypothetical protein